MSQDHLLEVLTRKGVLVSVSVRYWRAAKKLKPEDLGLAPDQVAQELINLGQKRLIPKDTLKQFALIEGRAHALVDASTFPFLNGLAHFLPNSRLSEVTDKLDSLEQEFRGATADFLRDYAEVRAQGLAQWSRAAEDLVSDPEHLLATIREAFPRPSQLEQRFHFSTQLFQIQLPEAMELQLTTRSEQCEIVEARRRTAQQAAASINRGLESFVSDCVASLRQQTAQLCEEMLESMKTGKTGVHQKTLNRLVRFIDEFKSLNFVGDSEMEQQLESVRQQFLLRSAEEYRDDQFAQSRLKAGLNALAGRARELARQDSTELVERFGQLGKRKFHLVA